MIKEPEAGYRRREFLRALALLAASAGNSVVNPLAVMGGDDPIITGRPLVQYPEKTKLSRNS